MKSTTIIYSIFILFVLLLGCKDKSCTTCPSYGPTVVVNSTFEGGLSGSLQGWQYRDSRGNRYVMLSNEVSSSGGTWSLKLMIDKNDQHHIFIKSIPPSNLQANIASFSFDVKLVDSLVLYADCIIWTNLTNSGSMMNLGSWPEWGRASTLKLLTISKIDSVVINFFVDDGREGAYALVDNIKMEFYPK